MASCAAFFMLVPSAYPPGGDSGPTQPIWIGSPAARVLRPISGRLAAAPAVASTLRRVVAVTVPLLVLFGTGGSLDWYRHPVKKPCARQGEAAPNRHPHVTEA
jgi:hypothetical protein